MKYLYNIGPIRVPEDIDRIFSKDGKYLISPNYPGDLYFEITGEVMYYALKGEELTKKVKYEDYKNRILEAIINRSEKCGGILTHTNLMKDGEDTQLRATSSVIRTLIVAHKEGKNNVDLLTKLINYHYKFYFEWGDGIWFCHDTSEYNGRLRPSCIQKEFFGKQKNNTLTLNTHLDSLTTLFFVKSIQRELMSLDFSVDDYISSGLKSLESLAHIDENHSFFNHFLQKIDSIIFNYNLNHRNRFVYRYNYRVHPYIFKRLSPTLFFNSGYIGRDLSFADINVNYFIDNMMDIARLLCMLKNYGIDNHPIFSIYYNRLSKSVKYATDNKEYLKYIQNSQEDIAATGELVPLLHVLGIEEHFETRKFEFSKYSPFKELKI